MRFKILNVKHGFCAYAIAEDNSVLLFDCGHSSDCRPSSYLWEQGIRTVRRLFVTNYDEDHLSDLPNIREVFNVEILTRNTSLTSPQLRSLKLPPISDAMEALLEMIDTYTSAVSEEKLQPPGIKVEMFHNHYPVYTETNNLSLLIFLTIGGKTFALPGDLERSGWLSLLQNSRVCQRLRDVDVFVASHHGRENGYCQDVFYYCSPSLIVMSDGPVKYSTQEMASTYGQHVSGEYFNVNGSYEYRKVVTTRKDGHIWWTL